MTEQTTPGNNHYVETVRRSYSTLMHIATVLEAARPSGEAQLHQQEVITTVARFVHRLLWADGRAEPGEFDAIAAVLDADRSHGGRLMAAFGQAEAGFDGVPSFLLTCADYDRANGTRLTGSAINTLEAMGLALLAADGEIVMEELSELQTTIADWRGATLL